MATDGTQYLIELAAKFSGGDSAISKLSELGDKMLAAGATSVQLESASKSISAELEKVAAAASDAANAVLGGEKSYRSAEIAADRAAKKAEDFGAKAQAQVGKLQAAIEVGDADDISRAEQKIWSLIGKQQEAIEVSNKAAGALKTEAAALDALKAKATGAAAKHDDLKKGVANVDAAAAKAAKAEKAIAGTGKVNEMAEALGKLGGPAGVAGQKVFGLATGFQKLGTAMGSAGPYVAVAVAIIAIASAAIAATYAITKWGVSMADANRTQSMLVAGIARSVKGGEALEGEIAKIGRVVPLTNDELTDMAKKLADGGLRGKELNAALERTAVNAAKLKFGPEFQKQMLSLDFQAKKLDANISDTFGGLDIEKFLTSLSNLVDLFDSSTASGKTLKFLFEGLFQPIVDGATGGVYFVERLFLQAEIFALKAYLALRPYSDAIVLLGKAFLIGAAVIGGVLAVAVAGFVVTIVGAVGVIGALGAALYQVIKFLYLFGETLVNAFGDLGTKLFEVGGNLMDGFVDGVLAKGSAVIDAMTKPIKDGYAAVTKFLQIGSPSKLLYGTGSDTGEGFTGGVEDSAGDAQSALESMVAPPPAASAGGSRAGGGGGLSLSIGELHVHGSDAKGQADSFIEEITKRLESLGIVLGGGEVPA